MTDDQLNRLWLRGVSVEAIARECRKSHSSIRARIKRLRAKDPEAWPRREAVIHPKGSGKPKYQRKRAGPTTLPPLDSLR